jgi:hypothetical protein
MKPIDVRVARVAGLCRQQGAGDGLVGSLTGGGR